MPNPNDLSYGDTQPNTFPTPPNRGRPSGGMPGENEIRQNNEHPLPGKQGGTWSIELRYLPIGPRGHAFFALIDPQKNLSEELHGLAFSRNTGAERPFGADGDRLMGLRASVEPRMGWQQYVGHIADGSYDDVVENRWAAARDALKEINDQNFDYKGYDPAWEFDLTRADKYDPTHKGYDPKFEAAMTRSGGQVQNSNSVAYTLLRRMKPDLEHDPVAQQGWSDKFPGWGRNLLSPDYRPYKVPVTRVEDPSLP